jgi:hypothetical protein
MISRLFSLKAGIFGDHCRGVYPMKLIIHILILAFAAIVILGAVLFVVIDMFTRVDYLKDKAPWLERMLERRSAFGVLLLVTTFLLVGDGYELLIKEMPEANSPKVTFPAPVGPTTAPSAPRVAKAHNPASPIELVDFASGQYASVQNNEGQDVFVTDLQTKQAIEFQIWPLNLAIGPRKIEKVSMTTNRELETLGRTADDWNENYRKAAAIYGQNCLSFEYFSPHDSSLEMMRNAYASNNEKIADAEVDGVLHYRTMRSPKKVSMAVKLVAVLERGITCTPAK